MSEQRMTLRELLAGLVACNSELEVTGLATEASAVQSGDLFIARAGIRYHGLQFLPEAMSRGCAAIIYDPVDSAPIELIQILTTQPAIAIDKLDEQLGKLAARWYGDPSSHLHLTGVTGTNGKTSVVHLLAQALTNDRGTASTIGTLGIGPVDHLLSGTHTTPDAVSLQSHINQARTEGHDHVLMEVSSHALDQHRVDGLAFEVAVLTNLTRDHLDYHGSLEAYAAAKQRLFLWPGLRVVVINADDALSEAILRYLDPSVQSICYGVEHGELRASDIQCSTTGLQFTVSFEGRKWSVSSPLLGRFNVHNLLAVAGVLLAHEWSMAEVIETLASLRGVPGRMDTVVSCDLQPTVVVDYAHTPDALDKALSTLREHEPRQLTAVFGCGGDRDRGKRLQMGKIAQQHADRVVLTDDNPRYEDADVIIADILEGMTPGPQCSVIRDRACAIRTAIVESRQHDIVLIAGKGHEPYQEVCGVRHTFDDRDQARQVLEELSA